MKVRTATCLAIISALICIVVAADSASLTARAQQQPQVLRMLVQSHPDAGKKCLDIPGAQYVIGMRLQTFECNNQNEEVFAYDQGSQRLIIGHLCVEAWGRGNSGDAVGLGVCNNQPQQRWKVGASGNGDYYQISGFNDLCLDVRGGQKDSGATMQIFTCGAVSNQLWALIEAPTAQAPKCTRYSLSSYAGNIEFMRAANDDWVNHFVDASGKPWTFNWHVLSESDSEIVLYDKSRDRYVRADLFGRKTYARNGGGTDWGTPTNDIIRSDC